MKSFYRAFTVIFLIILQFTQVVAQTTNPNCPDAPQYEVDHCDNVYENDLNQNDVNQNVAHTDCLYTYQDELDQAIDWYLDYDKSEEWLESTIEYYAEELANCEIEAFNSWADANMEAADDWNSCLCESADCNYYCNL
jgi:hypothetical protein